MGVIRITKHEAPYVMLDKTALKDKRLSFRAKGLHAYLMSKPDDWTIHIEDLAKQSPSEGREAVASGLKELEMWGYIRRQRVRDARGRMAGWDTVVYETPWLATMADEDAQLTGDSPKTGLPTSAKPISVDEPETLDMSGLTPKTGLPTSVEPMSVPPKTGLPNAANPQLLMNVTTQRNETTDPPLPPQKGKGGERGSRVPEDWEPTDEDLSWAKRKGYHTILTLADVTEQFVNYWRSRAKDNTKLDWSLTWKNRVMDLAKQELDRRARVAPTHQPPSNPPKYQVGDILPDGSKKGKII